MIALAVLMSVALIHRLFAVSAAGHGPRSQDPAKLALKPRAAISVLVLNGNGRAGAAGNVSSRLVARGYGSVPATNAAVTTYGRSVVLFRPGWEAAAQRLAKDARIRAVEPLDGSLPAAYAGYPLVAIVGR